MKKGLKPSEAMYQDYRDNVILNADVVEDNRLDYPDEYDDIHQSVWEVVDSDRWVTHYGWSLVTVLLSDQDPDHPDYCQSWDNYADLSNPRELSWSSVVQAMAEVCLYSDIREALDRRNEQC